MKDVIQFHSNRDQFNIKSIPWMFMEQQSNVFKDIQEGNHAMKDVIQFRSNGDQININSIPWMFMEQ